MTLLLLALVSLARADMSTRVDRAAAELELHQAEEDATRSGIDALVLQAQASRCAGGTRKGMAACRDRVSRAMSTLHVELAGCVADGRVHLWSSDAAQQEARTLRQDAEGWLGCAAQPKASEANAVHAPEGAPRPSPTPTPENS